MLAEKAGEFVSVSQVPPDFSPLLVDIRVVLTWATDFSDVELWIEDVCTIVPYFANNFFSHPERFVILSIITQKQVVFFLKISPMVMVLSFPFLILTFKGPQEYVIKEAKNGVYVVKGLFVFPALLSVQHGCFLNYLGILVL